MLHASLLWSSNLALLEEERRVAKAFFFKRLHHLNLKEYNFARQKTMGACFISSCFYDKALAPNSAHG
eukprot:10547577-Ditylum_brightwellii.AAC.1